MSDGEHSYSVGAGFPALIYRYTVTGSGTMGFSFNIGSNITSIHLFSGGGGNLTGRFDLYGVP